MSSKQVAKLSGNANNGTNAGTFYWNLNNTSSNVNVNISSQLNLFQKVIKFYNIIILASWQNTKQTSLRVGRLILEDSEVK